MFESVVVLMLEHLFRDHEELSMGSRARRGRYMAIHGVRSSEHGLFVVSSL